MTGDRVDLGIPGVTAAQRIGSGGNAIVYRARQPELDRAVVVKVLMVGDADATQRRFDRERRAMGRLSQAQGIAPVYDSGFTRGGQPYLIMPFYEHGSLQDRLELAGPLDAEDVRRIGGEISNAVQTAHDHGVLHRDLKPANILITRTGRADVADFGIAQILDDSGGRSQAITMTPLYTAPEVFDGAAPSRSADVYSLGALLYALLNGRPAHADTSGSASVLSLMLKIKDQPLPPLPDTVPDELVAIVAKAMHKDIRKRYVSAGEVASALARADLTPPRRSRPSRVRGARRSSRRVLGLAVAGLVVLAVVGTVAAIFVTRGGESGVSNAVVEAPSESSTEEPTPSQVPGLPAAITAGIDASEVEIEAFSCGGVEQSRGVLVGRNLVLAGESVGYRPWHIDIDLGADGSAPARVVSLDEQLDLASLRITGGAEDLAAPTIGRAIADATVYARDTGGEVVASSLEAMPDGTFGLEPERTRLDTGSAIVNSAGSLVGVMASASPPRVVPVVGTAIEGWQPSPADLSCLDRSDALGADSLDRVRSPRLRELLQLQRLSEAYAAEDWELVREIEPGKSSLDDDAFASGWRPLERSYLFPVLRDEISPSRVLWRLGLVGHERWGGEDLTTLFCVWWEVDPATGLTIQTNKDTVRVYGSQDGEPKRSDWVDPGDLLGEIRSEC